MRTIEQVLREDYGNNKSHMAKAYGTTRNTIRDWIKAKYTVNNLDEVIKVMATKLVFEESAT